VHTCGLLIHHLLLTWGDQGEHKKIHKSTNPLRTFFPPNVVSKPDPESGLFNPFPTFAFTGPLRPVYPLSAKREVPKSIPHPDYAADGVPRSEQRFIGRHNVKVLDVEEQEGMRKVCRLAREVLDIAAAEVRPGVTTDYLDEVVHKACVERNVRMRLIFSLLNMAEANNVSLIHLL
jgi:methionyl aminopeptidase